MTKEPLLDEIRKVRHEISQQIGHDPRKIVEYYAKLQLEHKDRLVKVGQSVAPKNIATSKE